MFCVGCPLRAGCTKPCREVEALLPKDETARLNRAFQHRGGEFLRSLEARHRLVLLMLDYRAQLQGRMRRVFDLKFNGGLTHAEIARRLHISTRVAGIYLQRAYRRIAKLINRRSAQRQLD